MNQATGNLYANAKNEGLIVDLSDSYTHICPFIGGILMEDKVRWYKIGERDLTEYMLKLLVRESGQYIKYFEYAKLIKEKTCYCAFDYYEELKCVNSINYELPDSNIIVKNERIKSPEVLFNPNILYKEEVGLERVCYDILQDIYKSYDNFLFDKIILAGGNSMIDGFPERFKKEIKRLTPSNSQQESELKVIVSPERIDNTWIGGSVISAISSFDNQYIT